MQLENEFYPFFMHVEDHVGGDVFQTSETTARAQRYSVSGIPEVMIGGSEEYVGASPCDQIILDYEEGIMTSLGFLGSLTPIDITGGMEIVGFTATVTANIELVDDETLPALQATLFIVEDNITWCCGFGNEDHWDKVTRMVRSTPVAPTFGGGTVQVVESMDVSAFNTAELHAYAIVEAVSGTQEVYQATDFNPPSYFFTQTFDAVVGSAPDGNETVLLTGAVEALGEAADVIDISIDNGFGWPADFQVEGDPMWHTSTSVPLASGEQKLLTVRVQTDGTTRKGVGTLTSISQGDGRIRATSLTVFNGSPAILLVDDDGVNTFEVTFTDAFDALGYLYDVHEVLGGTGPYAADMNGYDAVVWHTALLQFTLEDPREVDDLQTFIDGGGSFFLSSMDFLTQEPGHPFVSDYLGIADWTNNAGATQAAGVDGDPITDGMNFALDWTYPTDNRADHLVPGGATGILTDEDGEFVAVRYELLGGSRTVLNTVMMDAFVDGLEPNTRQTMIANTLAWILGEDDPADVREGDLSKDRILLSASPNPTAPTTVFRFRLSDVAARGPVSLILVDARGRRVRSLVDERLQPGAHVVSWDGRDDANRRVAGGVYFGRLQTVEGSSRAKVVKVD